MKTNLDKVVSACKGWEVIKAQKVFTEPFANIQIAKFVEDLIIKKTGYPLEDFCWYSFYDNHKLSEDHNTIDLNKYDVFYPHFSLRNKEVSVLFEKGIGTIGEFVTWNEEFKAGFLDDGKNYGYFIKFK